MVLKIGTREFVLPPATNWFNQNCNNLQMVTLYSTGWQPLEEKVGQFMTYASQNVQGNEASIVTELTKVKNYLNTLLDNANAYRVWAMQTRNLKRKDKPEGCPKSDSDYNTQIGKCEVMMREMRNLRDSVENRLGEAEALYEAMQEGGAGYNARLEQTIAGLQDAGKKAEKASDYSKYALWAVAGLVFVFIIFRIVKRKK